MSLNVSCVTVKCSTLDVHSVQDSELVVNLEDVNLTELLNQFDEELLALVIADIPELVNLITLVRE